MIVFKTFYFLRYVGRHYMTLLNHELVSRVKICLVCAFSDIVKD